MKHLFCSIRKVLKKFFESPYIKP
ncbi:MAG: hypothetical protein ACK40E_05125 [Caldimicrobium sp.]